MEEKNFFKGEWKEVEKLGEGSFGIVYKAVKEQYGVKSYSAIKQIKIPQTDKEYSTLKSLGMTQNDIEKSYDSQVKKWIEEIEFLNQFKDNENIVSIEDFEVLEREDKPGRTINIRMELLQNIDDHVMDRTVTDKKVLKMASDILKALEECEEKNVVHRDIKPDNVFVNSRGTYKLGDFGEAKSIEKTVSNMSKKGTENYMAPEIYKGERGSRSVDTYSLGIMLYKYFNNNRLPFIPDYPNQITFEDMEKALEKRMNGEEMKAPVKASNRISRIILKACSYKPQDRYKSAMDFRNDIEEELRAITNPIKLFDFQEGEIEKDNSVSEYDKTTGIFEGDNTNIKSDFDRTTGIFDDNSKNEKQNNKHTQKPREIIEKVHTENIRVDNVKINQNTEENYTKKQFEYQEEREKEYNNYSNIYTNRENEYFDEVTKTTTDDEEHYIGSIEYIVPNNYKKYTFTEHSIQRISSNFIYSNMEIIFKMDIFFTKNGGTKWLIKEGIQTNSNQTIITINNLDITKVTYYQGNKKNYVFYFHKGFMEYYYIRFIIDDETIEDEVIKIVQSIRYEEKLKDEIKARNYNELQMAAKTLKPRSTITFDPRTNLYEVHYLNQILYRVPMGYRNSTFRDIGTYDRMVFYNYDNFSIDIKLGSYFSEDEYLSSIKKVQNIMIDKSKMQKIFNNYVEIKKISEIIINGNKVYTFFFKPKHWSIIYEIKFTILNSSHITDSKLYENIMNKVLRSIMVVNVSNKEMKEEKYRHIKI